MRRLLLCPPNFGSRTAYGGDETGGSSNTRTNFDVGANGSAGNWINPVWTLVYRNASQTEEAEALWRPWSFWEDPDVRLLHSASCKLHPFLTYLARDVATCMPHRLLAYQSGPLPPLIYALGSATLVGGNALVLWKFELLQPTEQHRGYLCDSADKTFKRIFTIIELSLYAGLQFLLLLVFNGSILYCLCRSRHRMEAHSDRRVGQQAAVARGPDTNTHFGILHIGRMEARAEAPSPARSPKCPPSNSARVKL